MPKRATIQYEFSSLSQLTLHFVLSIVELIGALAILALQIFATVTQICAYPISIGFWSFPILFISPLIIWIALWHRRSWICIVGMMIQLLATLVATGNILLSIFVLLNQLPCSTASLSSYDVPVRSIWIGMAAAMKVSHYAEVLLLYKFIAEIRLTDEQLVLSPPRTRPEHPRSAMIRPDLDDSDTLFV